MLDLTCTICGNGFQATRRKTYCSKACHSKKHVRQVRRWREGNPERYRAMIVGVYDRRAHVREKLRIEVLARYGADGRAACVHCGFDTDTNALTFDHVENNGGAERAVNWRAGYALAAHLKKSGYPRGYQTLCANCNQAKEIKRRRRA